MVAYKIQEMSFRQEWLAAQANAFCGRCGAPTVPIEAGAKRCCTKDKRHRLYPRTDPVVCLLMPFLVLKCLSTGVTAYQNLQHVIADDAFPVIKCS